MSLNANNIASKGIIGGVPGTKGFIILEVEQGAVAAGGGFVPGTGASMAQAPKEAQKWIRVKFEHDEKTWEKVLYIDKNVEVKMDNLEIVSENKEPVVNIVGFEQEVNVVETIVTIEIEDI